MSERSRAVSQLKEATKALLAFEVPGSVIQNDFPTQTQIRAVIEQLRPAFSRVTDEEAEALALEFEEIHGVSMSDGAILQDNIFEPWLDATRSEIGEFYYWERYRRLITEKGLSRQVLGGLGNVTDRILGLLENPRKLGKWDRRGMVIGHVQSGKTANYIGVVSKAADAGYRVIIIIAGLQNNLRNQTQQRVDEGFIGSSNMSTGTRKFSKLNRVGVGRYDSRRQPVSFTTSYNDFRKDIAQNLNLRLQNLQEPAVFVIKKNSSTLRSLIDWLRTHNASLGTETIGDPMLLIDDEADNASINIEHRSDHVSRINGQIRELLNLFDRSCYVGYTATPFANIFIDPDTDRQMEGQDLFPRDFIVSLDAPTNYFGPSRVFDDIDTSVVQELEDYGDLLPTSHRKDHDVANLPESLRKAIRVFIVARAIRLLRGQIYAHNSMLVNVSRFIDVQVQIRNLVQIFVEKVRSSVRVNGLQWVGNTSLDPEIEALKKAFYEEYAHICSEKWEDIQLRLHDSVSAISVVAVNSQAAGSLDYAQNETKGLNVIAVGGLSLSRGLTLEGLTVSYFLRRSMMYDTLFQMGRWFGYREQYEDLCRVWMPEEQQGWYEHVTESMEELRDELAKMQSVNATPRDFGLRVRSHPDTLLVTAKNKIGSGKVLKKLIGLANKFVETSILHNDKETVENNLQAVVRLANELRKSGQAPEDGERVGHAGGRLVRDVPVSIVDSFLSQFKNHPASLLTEIDPVRKYIGLRARDELSKWDVFFAGVKDSRKSINSLVYSGLGFELVCQRRAAGKRSDSSMLMVTNKQRVSSRGITKVGLTTEQAQRAEKKFDEEPKPRRGKNYPDRIYGQARKKPLLIVHLLAIGEIGKDFSCDNPIAAWSISFPGTRYEEDRVEYIVNTTWYRQQFGDDDTDDETNTEDE